MSTTVDSVARRSDTKATQPPVVPDTQALSVVAEFVLSETGRKASLLAGGDGRARQRITVSVPVARLHLVAVSVEGVARLKLQPHFELADDRRILRRDTPPTYDVPPTVDDLFRDASRNYELERTYQQQRATRDGQRRDKGDDVRAEVAEAFFADSTQRAMTFPVPSQKECFIATPRGRVLFDRTKHSGLARDVPQEAHRRFRADLRANAERRLQAHATQTAVWDAKKRVVDEWVAAHGTEEQRSRHAAGVLCIAKKQCEKHWGRPATNGNAALATKKQEEERKRQEAVWAKQQAEAERWRKELRPQAVRLVATRAAKLPWSRMLLRLLLEEIQIDDLFIELVGKPETLPLRRYPQAVAVALTLRHS